jgi:DNA-binding response OmpR family regulator
MLKKMRADEWGKTAKVIILTNLSDEGASQQSLENGALDFLVKAAWTMDDVLLRVRAVLEKANQAAA